MGNALLYRRSIIDRIVPTFEYIVFYVVFAGGFWYRQAEHAYIKNFDKNHRQKQKRTPDQEQNRDKNHWENPMITGIKRIPSHAPWHAFKDSAHAVSYFSTRINNDQPSINRYYLASLSFKQLAMWDFRLIGTPNAFPEDWILETVTESAAWSQIQVPGHWQLQNFDIPIYTNTMYPFEFDPPNVRRTGHWTSTDCDAGIGGDVDSKGTINQNEPGENATGLYRLRFNMPSTWITADTTNNHKYYLVLEGVDSSAEVWVNGSHIGYGQDSCLPCEFDITEVVERRGLARSHWLCVKVTRWCDGSYVEDQDKWWLSGIYRDVYITRKPHTFIFDYQAKAENVKFSDCLSVSSCDLKVTAIVSDEQRINTKAMKLEIYESKSDVNQPNALVKCIEKSFNEIEFSTYQHSRIDENEDIYASEVDLSSPKGLNIIEFTVPVQNWKAWSAESPSLYTIVLSLYHDMPTSDHNHNDNPIDVEAFRFGIRTVSLSKEHNELCVNQVPITIAGINRHEFDPIRGRAVSKELMLTDVKLLKQLNFNAVRCSHYPPHHHFFDLCDELGLYVIDEANIETHGFQTLGQPVGYLSHLSEWRSALFGRVTRMFERDKNHSSIIMWSLGNESGVGPTHFLMADWLRARDKSRFVQYESGGARSEATDIICPMYHRPKWLKIRAKTDAKKRPVILCEYAHAMGNSGGCLKDYWDLFRSKAFPRIQGGFIWDMIDQGLLLEKESQERGRPCYAYGGDFGDFPNSKQFCCNGILGPDRSLHPSAMEASALQCPVSITVEMVDSIAQIQVTNYRSHTDLSDLDVLIALRCDINSAKDPYVYRIVPCQQAKPGETMSVLFSDIFSFSNHTLHSHDLLDELMILTQLSQEEMSMATEFWLDVSVRQHNENRAIPRGHELLRTTIFNGDLSNQFILFTKKLFRQGSVPLEVVQSPVTYVVSESTVVISWGQLHSSATIDIKTGRLSHWDINGDMPIFTHPIEPCLWRAPLDNDLGGGPLSFAARWKAAGLDQLSIVTESVQLSGCETLEDKSVRVRTKYTLAPSGKCLISCKVKCECEYIFHVEGMVKVTCYVNTPSSLPPLPRIGLRFAMTNDFSEVSWYGLGPHEAYDDRKAAAYLGNFDSSIDRMHIPYVFPQDCGRRAEPRWIYFKSQGIADRGVLIIPNADFSNSRDTSGWGFSASYHSMEALTEAKHDFELSNVRDSVFVHIDRRMMGVGGYDSWSPNVTQDYLIEPAKQPIFLPIDNVEKHKISIVFVPVHLKSEKCSDIQKHYHRLISAQVTI